jgi:hypothetical protein
MPRSSFDFDVITGPVSTRTPPKPVGKPVQAPEKPQEK